MVIELGFLFSLVGLALYFGGLIWANNITDFEATPSKLAIVAVCGFVVTFIPNIGGLLFFIVQYVFLKKLYPQGNVIYLLLVAIPTTALILLIVAKFI
jgi:hypothetical protein